MTKKILVIGGGQAAASFIAKYRSLDKDAQISLVCDEQALPYQRPPLSKKYATGEMTADQLQLRPADWYEENQVRCLQGIAVSGIDRERKVAKLSNGEEVSWDQVLLTTGSRARNLPTAIGGNLPGVHVLRTLEDADAVSSQLVEGKHVAIIGGGYIGLEAAAVCASRGMRVTLVEAAERILQRVACKETSTWFCKLHESKGVTIHQGQGLDRLTEENGRVSKAVLSDGAEIHADFILVGIGIIPNVELAADAGLAVEGGVVVNENCQTSDPDIFAAGDCAAFQYKKELTRLESVQNAIDQAECAATNMAGEPKAYHPYPWFWSDQYDVKLQIAGLNRGYDSIVVRPGEREGAISHFYFKGNEFLAVDSMNDPRTYMVCKKLLETGKTITPEQAADPELQLKSLM